jgi:CRISPR-associated protein Cas5t
MFLRLKAPFAAFRPGDLSRVPVAFRPTTPIPSPSAVYGLLLNLAGIEQREDIPLRTAPIRQGLPELEIAIGVPNGTRTETAILSQQLHQYLVGNSDKELAKKTHGAKPWIAPARREVLMALDLVVGVRGNEELRDRIIAGLNGDLKEPRYGLPFAGDNNFLFDSIDIEKSDDLVRWYSPLQENARPQRGSCRLAVWIDRADNSQTQTAVFAPGDFMSNPPESAWVTLPDVPRSGSLRDRAATQS